MRYLRVQQVWRQSSIVSWVFMALVMASCGGCAASRSPGERDSKASMALVVKARDVQVASPAEAEEILRQAVSEDEFNGMAHNNLGVVLLKLGRMHEAAWEFDCARKLLPGHPEPRVNMALVLERCSRYTEAHEAASAALEIAPDYLPAMEVLALLGSTNSEVGHGSDQWLHVILERESDGVWQEWSRGEIIRRDGNK